MMKVSKALCVLVPIAMLLFFGVAYTYNEPTVNATVQQDTIKIYAGETQRYYVEMLSVVVIYDGDYFQISYFNTGSVAASEFVTVPAMTGSVMTLGSRVYEVTEDQLHRYVVLKEI